MNLKASHFKKQNMKSIFVVALFFTIGNVHAQFDGLFKRTTDAVQRKVEQKVNEKINEGVDKGVEKAADVITGRKKKGNGRKPVPRKEERDETTNEMTDAPVLESKELRFQTSITTITAKEKMEHILRETDGVSSVSIDSDTGMVYLTPSSDKNINETVQDLIRKNGFTAELKNDKK